MYFLPHKTFVEQFLPMLTQLVIFSTVRGVSVSRNPSWSLPTSSPTSGSAPTTRPGWSPSNCPTASPAWTRPTPTLWP